MTCGKCSHTSDGLCSFHQLVAITHRLGDYLPWELDREHGECILIYDGVKVTPFISSKKRRELTKYMWVELADQLKRGATRVGGSHYPF